MTLNLQTPFPTFGGSTGGWLRAAEVEEKYAITWTSSKEQIFEMPTGGAAIMRNGENLLYLARKEQCLALGTQLRTFKINNYKIYRIFPSGEVQYLHPKDGVFPEKVNPGRTSVNSREFSIGKKTGMLEDAPRKAGNELGCYCEPAAGLEAPPHDDTFSEAFKGFAQRGPACRFGSSEQANTSVHRYTHARKTYTRPRVV